MEVSHNICHHGTGYSPGSGHTRNILIPKVSRSQNDFSLSSNEASDASVGRTCAVNRLIDGWVFLIVPWNWTRQYLARFSFDCN